MDPESQFLFLTSSSYTVFSFVLLLLLLFCSALISGAEVAFFSLSQSDLDRLSKNSSKENTVVGLLKNPKKLLATILITNNFINILIVLVFASLEEVFFSGIENKVLVFLVQILLVTFLILLFGEVLPKVYASRKPTEFASFLAKPIHLLNTILTPVSTPLTSLTTIVERSLSAKQSNLSVEKLSQALELTSEGATSKNEQKLLQGIISFGATETVQIMKPRTEVCAISDQESYDKVLNIILKNGYSRNPVYHETIDKVVGVLYAKDLLAHLNTKNFEWQQLLRKPFFVPENKKLDDLLSDFQSMKNHMAIVVDEYGGTSGVVTLEDVIEEIVGGINEEFEVDDVFYSKIDVNNYVFDGKISLIDLCRVIGINEGVFEKDKGESETLAGFILELSGNFPKLGEKIKFKNYTFVIESLDRRRIKQVKLTRDA